MNHTERPRMMAYEGHFSLWQTGPHAFTINDERCPHAHAHVVWSGADESEARTAFERCASRVPSFVRCAP